MFKLLYCPSFFLVVLVFLCKAKHLSLWKYLIRVRWTFFFLKSLLFQQPWLDLFSLFVFPLRRLSVCPSLSGPSVCPRSLIHYSKISLVKKMIRYVRQNTKKRGAEKKNKKEQKTTTAIKAIKAINDNNNTNRIHPSKKGKLSTLPPQNKGFIHIPHHNHFSLYVCFFSKGNDTRYIQPIHLQNRRRVCFIFFGLRRWWWWCRWWWGRLLKYRQERQQSRQQKIYGRWVRYCCWWCWRWWWW